MVAAHPVKFCEGGIANDGLQAAATKNGMLAIGLNGLVSMVMMLKLCRSELQCHSVVRIQFMQAMHVHALQHALSCSCWRTSMLHCAWQKSERVVNCSPLAHEAQQRM